VTVRLLDPPLHEFLPHEAADIEKFAKVAGISADAVDRRLGELHESNPMLGHRGCRLGITYPEIYEMQARAIFEGALEAAAKTGEKVEPEIMIPLVGAVRELEILRTRVEAIAEEVFAEKGATLAYTVGTMIELPRAALTADEIAGAADFFSFGTNDLTQTTLGMSRDDAANFLPAYVDHGIYERDPFASLDTSGVGRLIELAKLAGRSVNETLKLGICGEHGGDPASVEFCEKVGLDYVSCSPYRVPIARLAAAQATIKLEADRLGKSQADAQGAQKAA
jgi:pyruvate,orthophosphate dikinase